MKNMQKGSIINFLLFIIVVLVITGEASKRMGIKNPIISRIEELNGTLSSNNTIPTTTQTQNNTPVTTTGSSVTNSPPVVTTTTTKPTTTTSNTPTSLATLPVLVIRYFPLVAGADPNDTNSKMDLNLTGDFGSTISDARAHMSAVENGIVTAMSKATKYLGYKKPDAISSLNYKVFKVIEHFNDVPLVQNKLPTRFIDNNKVMSIDDVCHYVDTFGVREVWLWANWKTLAGTSESKMASASGDISNSPRLNDLPLCAHTYILYNFNPTRGVSEAMESRMHQLESQFAYLDNALYQKFVGPFGQKDKDQSCGWAHYPPNATGDYDWADKRYVMTDCFNWNPEGTGVKESVNCDKWKCDSTTWFIMWMQTLPGADNTFSFNGKKLSNYWSYVQDWDYALKNRRF